MSVVLVICGYFNTYETNGVNNRVMMKNTKIVIMSFKMCSSVEMRWSDMSACKMANLRIPQSY